MTAKRRLIETKHGVHYVPCPECGGPAEIEPEAVGPDRTDLWNVAECEVCGALFDYDDADVFSQ